MKKFRGALVLSAVILTISIFHLLHMKRPLSADNLRYIVITLFIVIGIPSYLWIEMKRNSIGKPIIDEMTKKIGVKATSTAYYLSIFVWPIVFGVSDILKLSTEMTYNLGLAGMLIVGLVSWYFYKLKGIKDV